MDRVTQYFGALVASKDGLTAQQNTMVALGFTAQAFLGTSTAVDGFGLAPTTPASLVANLSPGAVYQLENLEATVWSSLPANTASSIVKQGLMQAVDPITFTPPAATGYSQAFLVEVQYADLDTNPVLLPYYNAVTPSQPYSGPGGSGSSQNTARLGIVAVQVKAGVASTGTPAIPTPDAGWSGLYVVTLAAGQSTITAGNISTYAGAPFIPVKLPQVPSGVQSGVWTYGQDQGALGALAVPLSPVPSALTVGMSIRVRALNAAKGADTLTIAGTTFGNLPIQRRAGATPTSIDWAAGDVLTLCLLPGNVWQLAGLVLSDVGTAITTLGSAPRHVLYFTSSGTWTAPAGITSAYGRATGGGGGGGGGSTHGGGGGGSGGAYVEGPFTPVAGTTYTITVGLGGGGGLGNTSNQAYNGANGGPSSIGAFMTAGGGLGGGGGSDGVAGVAQTGGTATGGGVQMTGGSSGSGGSTGSTGTGTGGSGGNSPMGGSITTTTGGGANAGNFPGGGGGGGAGGNYGAAGAPGYVVIMW